MPETPISVKQLYNSMGVVPKTHVLDVKTTPFTGVTFTIDGVTHSTDWEGTLNEQSWTITMPPSVVSGGKTYNFYNWENGSTNRIRTISLTTDMVVTATYSEYIPPVAGYPANTFGEQWFTWVYRAQEKRWYKGGVAQ